MPIGRASEKRSPEGLAFNQREIAQIAPIMVQQARKANCFRERRKASDGLELMKTTDRMKLEDIVPKRQDAPYRPRLVERHR